MEGAGHGFEVAAPAHLERAYAALMQWFEQHVGSAAKESLLEYSSTIRDSNGAGRL